MNDARNIIQSPKDTIPIIKAAIALSSQSEVKKICLRGKVFYVEFNANLDKFTKAGSETLSAYMLNIMLCCYGYLKDYEVLSVEMLCWVGRDSHRIRTSMRILGSLYEATEGKLENITGAIVRKWVMDSTYKRVKGAR